MDGGVTAHWKSTRTRVAGGGNPLEAIQKRFFYILSLHNKKTNELQRQERSSSHS